MSLITMYASTGDFVEKIEGEYVMGCFIADNRKYYRNDVHQTYEAAEQRIRFNRNTKHIKQKQTYVTPKKRAKIWK